jgi:hypothetical protein
MLSVIMLSDVLPIVVAPLWCIIIDAKNHLGIIHK